MSLNILKVRKKIHPVNPDIFLAFMQGLSGQAGLLRLNPCDFEVIKLLPEYIGTPSADYDGTIFDIQIIENYHAFPGEPEFITDEQWYKSELKRYSKKRGKFLLPQRYKDDVTSDDPAIWQHMDGTYYLDDDGDAVLCITDGHWQPTLKELKFKNILR